MPEFDWGIDDDKTVSSADFFKDETDPPADQQDPPKDPPANQDPPADPPADQDPPDPPVENKFADIGSELVKVGLLDKEPESSKDIVDAISEAGKNYARQVLGTLPPEIISAIEFLATKKGSLVDFAKTLDDDDSIDTPEKMENLVRKELAKTNKDPDEIDDIIAKRKEKGTLASNAAEILANNKNAKDRAKNDAKASVDALVGKEKEKLAATIKKAAEESKKIESIGDVKLDDQKKRDYINSFYNPTVKVEGGYVTKFDQAIMKLEQSNDVSKIFALINFIENDYKIPVSEQKKAEQKPEKKEEGKDKNKDSKAIYVSVEELLKK